MSSMKSLNPTPKYNLKQYPAVYDPAEDSFLLLDTLELEDWTTINPSLVLEVGSGSGVVSAFLSSLIGPSKACMFLFLFLVYLCTDINEMATRATKLTSKLNNSNLEPIVCDFFSALRVPHAVDILVFNPPYVVTPVEELGSQSIMAAWAGGEHGRVVTDRFLPLVDGNLLIDLTNKGYFPGKEYCFWYWWKRTSLWRSSKG
jgi:release factor glutamine methyltransferase